MTESVERLTPAQIAELERAERVRVLIAEAREKLEKPERTT